MNKTVKVSNQKGDIVMEKILEKKEVFWGTMKDAEIIDNDYCLFTLDKEKFETITYLSEFFYGENAITGRIQRVHRTS